MFSMFGGGLSRGDYERSRFRARGERRDRYFFSYLLIKVSRCAVLVFVSPPAHVCSHGMGLASCRK